MAHADPVEHFLYQGWKENRDPSEAFNMQAYVKLNGKKVGNRNPLLHYERYGRKDPSIIAPDSPEFICGSMTPVSELLEKFYSDSKAFQVRCVQRETPRLNIVYNGFDAGAFFGGKATALTLAILFADKYGYDLRIISQDPDRSILKSFLELFQLPCPKRVEYYAQDLDNLLDVSEKDDFLCTMWTTADAVLHTPEITGKVFYIMQEVETFFYDHGDMHLRCWQTLTDPRLIPIVNSKLLYEYLCANGYENVKKNGICFEPVFSDTLLHPSETSFTEKEKYTLFFYGRPSHQRNVFYFGLDCLNQAFLTGRLDPNEWKVYLAGDASVPKFLFDRDVETQRLGVMSWGEYCKFVSEVDLCYSMIYTPHPSYPPLDTTTAGAVCVTNRCANKTDLSNYSENIVMADLRRDSMLDALEKGAALAKDGAKRKENYLHSHTAGQWQDAFAPVLEHMGKYIGE